MQRLLFICLALFLFSCQKNTEINTLELEVKRLDLIETKAFIADYLTKVNETTKSRVSAKTEDEVYYVDYINLGKDVFVDLAQPEGEVLAYTNESFIPNLDEMLDIPEATLSESDLENFSAEERGIFSSVMAAIQNEDVQALNATVTNVTNNVNSGNYDTGMHNRMVFLVASIEGIQSADFPALSLEKGCGSAAGWGALAGAILGGVRGLVKGCITGAVLGFNPGSAAAGCMGGMIVGIIGGAVTGGAGGYLACKLQ